MCVGMEIESFVAGFQWFRQETAKPLTVEMIASYSDSELDDHTLARLARRADLTRAAEVESLPPLVQAWLVTRVFEWEVGNGGLNRYFLNFEDRPWFLALVLRGYDVLGCPSSGVSSTSGSSPLPCPTWRGFGANDSGRILLGSLVSASWRYSTT